MNSDGYQLSPIFEGGSYGNKILYKNLDLAQDFPNKEYFVSLFMVKMLPKKSKIFRWPEMCCSLGKILAQDFEIFSRSLTKLLGRRDRSIEALLSTEYCKTLQTKTHTACTAVTVTKR